MKHKNVLVLLATIIVYIAGVLAALQYLIFPVASWTPLVELIFIGVVYPIIPALVIWGALGSPN